MLLIRHLNKTVILLLFYVFPFFGVKTLASSAPQIKIMTLNTWLIGTPFYNPSKDDQIRMNGMFEQVAKLSPDIVALQEVWKPEYRRQVVERFERMGYQTLDPSKIVKKGYALDYLGGSGLFVFSKHPATLRDFLPFSQYTQPVEGLIKKGAMWVDIDFPEYGTIQFVNTHTGAVSFDLERNDFSAQETRVRRRQVRELIEWIQDLRRSGVFFLTGDLNVHPYQWISRTNSFSNLPTEEYWRITTPIPHFEPKETLALKDSYFQIHQQIEPTYSKNNPYVVGREYKGPNQTLDYIFFGSTNLTLIPTRSNVIFEPSVNKTVKPLSDHYGLISEFQLF